MDREIVYAGQIPRSSDVLNTNKHAFMGISKLAEAILGSSTQITGLTCGPTSPATMSVQVQPGQIYKLSPVDSTNYGALSADTSHQVLKQGVLLDAVTLNCPAPTTSGFSINYLVQASFVESDTNSTVLSYYNSSDPSNPLSGPSGNGASQATTRQDQCSVTLKTGAAAATGTQQTPAPDSGAIGLYVVSVAYGQTTITASNISEYGTLPRIDAFGSLRADLASTDPSKGAALVGLPNGNVADAISYVTPQMFGAKGDGVTDDGPAFRAMCAYRKTNSGAMKVPNGTYYFATYDPVANSTDQYALFNVPSNCTLYGETFGGVILKIDNAVQTAVGSQRVSFIGNPPTSHNVIIGNFVGDMSDLTLNHDFHTYAIVQYNGDNVYLKNLKMDKPKGKWGIVGGQTTAANNLTGKLSDNVMIEDVFLTNVGKNADPTQTDFAGVYVVGTRHKLYRITVANDSTPLTNCSGVEIHTKDDTLLEDSLFKNCAPGTYIGNQGVEGTSILYGTQTRTRLRNNNYISCAWGIQIIDSVDDLEITGGGFYNCATPTVDGKNNYSILSTRISTTGNDAGVLNNVNIHGVTFVYDNSTTQNHPHIAISGLQNSRIHDNYMVGSATFISLESGLTRAKNISIQNNFFKNQYSNPGVPTVGVFVGDIPATGGAFTPALISDVSIDGNTFDSDTATTTDQYALGSSAGTAGVANITASNNLGKNYANGFKVFGTGPIKTDAPTQIQPDWTQSSGTQPAIGNGSLTLTASANPQGKVDCAFSFLSGSATTYGNTSTAWEFSLPYANGPRDTFGTATISSGASFAVVEIKIPANASYFTMGYNGQAVRSGWPFSDAAGNKINAQFSYFTE